jgi:hypothetical protein
MTNHTLARELKQYSTLSREQNWDIARWLRQSGRKITVTDLDSHPHIDDVITLLNIREALWHLMDQKEQACWGGYWSVVYQQKKPLQDRFWKKFNRIADNIQQRQLKQSAIRQLIQSVRQH